MKKTLLAVLAMCTICGFVFAGEVLEGGFSALVHGGASFVNVTDGLMFPAYGGGVQIVPFDFVVGNDDVSWILSGGRVGYSFRMTRFEEGNFFIHQIPISLLATGMNIGLFSFTVGCGLAPRWVTAEVSRESYFDLPLIVPFDISFKINDFISICANYTAQFSDWRYKFFQTVDVGVKFSGKYFEE